MNETTWVQATPALRRTIIQQGRSQAWLGSKLGRTRSAINHVVHGRRSIRKEDACQIATLLDTEFSTLFESRDRTKKESST